MVQWPRQVTLACQEDSELARHADVLLELPPQRPLASYLSAGALIAAAELYVVDALAAAIALVRREEFDERTQSVPEVVEGCKRRRANGRRK